MKFYDKLSAIIEERLNPIAGGVGDDMDIGDVDIDELKMGIRVELEHVGEGGPEVTDEDIDNFINKKYESIPETKMCILAKSQDIAFDHLVEPGLSDYYTRLKKMEEEQEIRWKGRFLLLAFFLFGISAIFDAIIEMGPVLLLIMRILLVIANFFFYLGFVLPRWSKRFLSIKEEPRLTQ